MADLIDLTGQTFGRLTILGRATRPSHIAKTNSNAFWFARCICGTLVVVNSDTVRRKKKKSCGCLYQETTFTHGLSRLPEYKIWKDMKKRCLNKAAQSYKYYGGRGIVVCDRWLHNFPAFYEDVGPRPSSNHSLERKNYNGPYSPENVIWIEKPMQNQNTRWNRKITFHGETKNLNQWAKEYELSIGTLYARLKYGWPLEKALTFPLDHKKGNGKRKQTDK